MVLITFLCVFIDSELLVRRIVVTEHVGSAPSSAAFDAKVVVSFSCQRACSRCALQESLCQRDACGHAMFFHLLHRRRSEPLDVVLVELRLSCRRHRKEQAEEEDDVAQ